MNKQTEITIKFSDGKIWMLESDEKGEYESEVTTFSIIDDMAKAKQFHWALQFKAKKAHRWNFSSVSTISIAALIDNVKEIMRIYPDYKVRALTPHLIVNCIKD